MRRKFHIILTAVNNVVSGKALVGEMDMVVPMESIHHVSVSVNVHDRTMTFTLADNGDDEVHHDGG